MKLIKKKNGDFKIEKIHSAVPNYIPNGEKYIKVHDKISFKDKAFLWYGIQVNTIKDDTTSKIAELLVQGTNMGIIEGRRILNNNEKLDTDVDKLLNDFVDFQEQSVERLKKFL